jgi:hypothetical protein
MTVINESELYQLNTLDQVLMWSIMSINASNLDSRNNYISDNAAIRAESKDYISWQVIQDETGAGRFIFSALLPIVNPHPLEDKVDLLSRVWSYSPYDPTMIIGAPIQGYGWKISSIPGWIDTTEKLLAYVAVLGDKILRLAPLVRGSASFVNAIKKQYWGNCQYQIIDTPYGSQMTITGYLTIDWATYMSGASLIRCLNPRLVYASNMNCNFPDLVEVWNVLPAQINPNLPVKDIIDAMPNFGDPIPKLKPEIEGDPNSAENLINSYNQRYFYDDAVPDWYTDAINNPPHLQTFNSSTSVVNNEDGKAPKIIESLPICKEQDPAVISYGKSPLASILGK